MGDLKIDFEINLMQDILNVFFFSLLDLFFGFETEFDFLRVLLQGVEESIVSRVYLDSVSLVYLWV